MAWNWQQMDWPNFAWDKALLRKAGERFLMESGVFAGTVKCLGMTNQAIAERTPIH
jgi:hypothetical protein